MQDILLLFRRWAAGPAILIAVPALGYLFATRVPLDVDWLYIALILGFLSCDGSLWPSRSR